MFVVTQEIPDPTFPGGVRPFRVPVLSVVLLLCEMEADGSIREFGGWVAETAGELDESREAASETKAPAAVVFEVGDVGRGELILVRVRPARDPLAVLRVPLTDRSRDIVYLSARAVLDRYAGDPSPGVHVIDLPPMTEKE